MVEVFIAYAMEDITACLRQNFLSCIFTVQLFTFQRIDIICALHILAEVARVSHPALQAIQGLICGYVPRKQDGKVNFIEGNQ